MKYLVLMFVLISHPLWVNAGEPLSKELIISFFEVGKKMDNLKLKHPETFKRVEELDASQWSDGIEYLEESKVYPEIKSILSSSSFKSLNELYDLSRRIVGSIYFVQLEQMPSDDELDEMEEQLEENIKMMESRGLPDETIVEMQYVLREQRSQREEIKTALDSASLEDKTFAKKNIDWLMSVLPEGA